MILVHSSAGSHGQTPLRLQLRSLLKKRFFDTWKKKLTFLAHMMVAIVTTILTLYSGEGITDPKSFDFNLNEYGETSVFYNGNSSDPILGEIQTSYDKLVVDQRSILENVESVSDAIINEGIKNIFYYERHMVVSAEFNQSENGQKIVNAMYSNGAGHGAPISLNLIMNSILKSIMGDQYSIKSSNHPLPMLIENSIDEDSEIDIIILWFICFPLGLLFLAAAFIIFPHTERISNIKQLQLMCGVRPVWYWLTCYLFDFILYLMVVFVILIYASVRSNNVFTGSNEIGTLFTILFAYGLCIIPYAYLFSYNKTTSAALASFLIVSIFASIVLTSVVMVMEFSEDDYFEEIGDKLKFFFLLFPQFGLTYTSAQFSWMAVWNHNWYIKTDELRRMICLNESNPCCDGFDTPQCIKYRSYFAGEDSLEANVLEMVASSVIYFALLLFLETSFARKIWNWRLIMLIYDRIHQKKYVPEGEYDRNDVLNEMNRVSKTLEREKKHGDKIGGGGCGTEEDVLLVHNLEKDYWNQKVVKDVTFGVRSGDCFGLLGVNGSGKTTTLRMLTGDEPILIGDARILDSTKHLVHISKNIKQFLKNISYCPQFYAINEVLTGREILTLFAEFRGITSEASNEVNYWIGEIGLEEYADKPVIEYSGGNKRKLSTALALIGSPLLIMLDGPTNGIDPISRRKLWDTLSGVKKQDKKSSVLLTSNNMDECEALCNKMAIMNHGQLEFCGTIPELKQKYGEGFTVMLKLKPTELTITMVLLSPEAAAKQNKVLTTVQSQYASKVSFVPKQHVGDSEEIKSLMLEFEQIYKGFCSLRDKHSGLLHYHISDISKRWGELFKEIETIKSRHRIVEDYSISETTFEEVYLEIARSGKNK